MSMQTKNQFPWKLTIVSVSFIALVIIGSVVFFKACKQSSDALEQIAEKFKTGNWLATIRIFQ